MVVLDGVCIQLQNLGGSLDQNMTMCRVSVDDPQANTPNSRKSSRYTAKGTEGKKIKDVKVDAVEL